MVPRDERNSPQGAGGRSGDVGELAVVEASRLFSNCSPELMRAAVYSGRAPLRRSGAKEEAGSCQKRAHGLRKTEGGDGRARGSRVVAGVAFFAGGNGGAPGMLADGLVALGRWRLGQKREGIGGYLKE